MKSHLLSLVIVVAVGAQACSNAQTSSDPTPAKASAAISAPSAEEKAHHEPKMPIAALDAFHGIMSPLWHDAVPKGDADRVCGAVPALRKSAQELSLAALPVDLISKQPAFRDAVIRLQGEIDSFEKSCANKGSSFNLQASFMKVHEAFHGVFVSLKGPGHPCGG